MERLSTGLRINSAADDAAGLAIASKMSSQINGLTQAIRNAQDATSMLSTADGALVAVTDMIQRMRELSIQAISDTNTESDRAALDLEYQALKDEIDRIAQNTQWNGRTFFDGTGFPEGATFQIGSEANQTINVDIGTVATNQLGEVPNDKYFLHASNAPEVNVFQQNFIPHGSAAPVATVGIGFSDHSSIAPALTAKVDNFIPHPTAPPAVNIAPASPSGMAAGESFIVNAAEAGRQSHPSVTWLNSGAFVAVWDTREDKFSGSGTPGVVAQIFDAGGNKIGSEFFVATAFSNNYLGSSKPLVTALEGTGGGFVVSWVDNDSVHAKIYDNNGVKITENLNMLPSTHLRGTQQARQPHHAIIPMSDGGWIVAGFQDNAGAPTEGNVIGRRIDGDYNLGDIFIIDQSWQTFESVDPGIKGIALSDSKFIVFWDHKNNNKFSRIFSSISGSANSSNVNALTERTLLPWNMPSLNLPVTKLADGSFITVYKTGPINPRELKAQRYDSDWNPIGSELNLAVNYSHNTGPNNPTVAALSDGGFVVAFEGQGIHTQRYNESGVPIGDTFMEFGGQHEMHASLNDAVAFVWAIHPGYISGNIHAQVYNVVAPTNESRAVINFNSVSSSLVIGDRVKLNVAGGATIEAVVGAGGVDELLTSLKTDAQSQTTIFSNVTINDGQLTFTGLSTGELLPNISVSMERNVKQKTIDFSNRELGAGDRITLNIDGGTTLQVIIDGNGLDVALSTLASEAANLTGMFSSASVSNGKLTLNGLNDGSELTSISALMEEDFAQSALDFTNKNLVKGDRITITVNGGNQVQRVISAAGLNQTLAELAIDIAQQTHLFSSASSHNGVLKLQGLDSAASMPALSVTIDDGIDRVQLDFQNKNLVEGDRITLSAVGGTEVQGIVDSDGLDKLLMNMASEMAAQHRLFSSATASGGILQITGPSDGSPMVKLDIMMENKPSTVSMIQTDITTFSNAQESLGRLDLAIGEINSKRASFGAAMSRLDYAADNLSNIVMNARASRSRVIDADYARETTELARTQIIQQAATAMLAQANMQASQVLELIEGSLID